MHKCFAVIMTLINLLLVGQVLPGFSIRINRYLNDAMGRRNEKKSLYRKCVSLVGQYLEEYEKREKKPGFYESAKRKMKRSGYRSEYAPFIYIFLRYAAPLLFFAISLPLNYPNVLEPALVSVVISVIVEMVVAGNRKQHNLMFQKYIYKIYKYLHNQISSGVKATDAIKTVYEVIEDKRLKEILIHLAAGYELTLDIDSCLDEFKSNFDAQEAETLCIALKQGIMTGDNQELLARQEDVMFKKYFNYIQAETDGCKTRIALSAALFTSIVVIMIAVPLFNDITEAVGKIFVN